MNNRRARASLATAAASMAASAAAEAAQSIMLNDPSITIRGVPYELSTKWLKTAIGR